jgi:ADP-ribose pyrophosphatase YjhB (NUDIX family)
MFELKSTFTNRKGDVFDVVYREGLDPNERTEGVWLNASHGVCFYQDKIVIVFDSSRGRWTLPGGGIEDGETWEQALVREVLEESNMNVLSHELIGFVDIHEPTRIARQTRSFCMVEPAGDFTLDPDGDITEIKLIDPGEWKQYINWAGEVFERIMERAFEMYRARN